MERGEFSKGDLDERFVTVSSMLESLGKIYYLVDRESLLITERLRQKLGLATRITSGGIRGKKKAAVLLFAACLRLFA
ncbi:MAG: hypothetical protein K0R67_3994 [Paenibacillus sp.]|nr:hypothetical protein [Paenibacillus sp.]